jgi:UDP-N-acetylglucosamine 2-epimerase (non-hydrolysing)
MAASPLASKSPTPTIISVVGARPNFMKLAPLARAFAARSDVRHVIVHTGQHYDAGMSDAFFDELEIPAPNVNLEVGSASHAQQTAAIMMRLEPALLDASPGILLVYGDVNSTVAAALVAAKLGIRVAHVEAGLRSRDWTMPEEINRVVTDRLADLLFTPSRDANENLRAEGVPADRIHFVGNIMIDSLVHALPAARARNAPGRLAVEPQKYGVVTLHRPANVDDPQSLLELLNALDTVSRDVTLLFPVHPRTRERIVGIGFHPSNPETLRLTDPIGYLDMLALVENAAFVITDSGGLQEETSYLGVPCLTVRPNTERPVTCTLGTNRLVPAMRDRVERAAREILGHRERRRPEIERWDGRTAARIVSVLLDGAAFR